MASCYDCIHLGACSDAGDSGFSCLKEDASKCKHFKHKVDVVEVVRCKDCMYHDDICKHPDGLFRTTDNSYCSFGKRKEKNENAEM